MRLSSLFDSKLYITSFKMAISFITASVLRVKHKNVWIVTERKNQARDNGYCFFKYLRKQHPEIEAYYIIDKSAEDYHKIEKLGNIIHYDSWKHYVYFCLSRIHISAHDMMCAPSDAKCVRLLRKAKNYKNVFLPHGVSYGISEFCLAKYGKFDLFICSGKPEYDNVLKNYGYSKQQIAYTGFPRLDGWHHIQVNPKQIVLMPTWRLYLAQNPDTIFEQTTYYKTYQSLISNPQLHEFLQENDLRLVFYLHHNMRKYVSSFCTSCDNIEIVDSDETYDIQELLKSSALLITDFSSVHFDFSYMGKPVIYYQFDKDEFFARQYGKADFDAETDGFGPVVYTEEALVDKIRESYDNGFMVDKKYHLRMRAFYELHDEHNCDRVYDAVKERLCK